MKISKEYTKQEIMRWTFADVCKYREYVWNKYLQYNDEDMQVINLAIGIIDACYRVAVNITIDGWL